MTPQELKNQVLLLGLGDRLTLIELIVRSVQQEIGVLTTSTQELALNSLRLGSPQADIAAATKVRTL